MPKSKHRDEPTKQRRPIRRRKLRSRPTPRWLKQPGELDEIGQRRCLLILSVLSGERPVTEAIAEAGITRPLYYELEKRALLAMLKAVTPGSEGDGSDGSLSSMRDLEEKISKLEPDKRRTERLLFLTRKVLKPGPHKTSVGWPPKTKTRSSPKSGRRISRRSKETVISKPSPPEASMPTKDGEVAS